MTTEVREEKQAIQANSVDPSDPDWYLQMLVGIANSTDAEFPITLFVNGLVVSGLLVSGHKYFEGLGAQFLTYFGGPSEENSKVASDLVRFGESYKTPPDEGTPPPQYLHLRNAQVFSPGQQPMPNTGSWWRGRLSSVSGFHFGSLSHSQQ